MQNISNGVNGSRHHQLIAVALGQGSRKVSGEPSQIKEEVEPGNMKWKNDVSDRKKGLELEKFFTQKETGMREELELCYLGK